MALSALWRGRPEPDPGIITALQEALQVDGTVARLLAQRGIVDFEQARRFFRPDPSQLHDPWEMRDMEPAVVRLLRALESGERILVYGDYDVDGTCSVALLYSFLSAHTDQACIYVPDRYEEGYGLSLAGMHYAHDNGVALIVALDCGTKDYEAAALARQLGIDLIICDHHQPGDALPEALAVLNPKRADCAYPYKELCGCGVGFKLVCALALRMGLGIEAVLPLLDLVALAIAADIVPMDGENRTLAALGLARLNQSPRPGLQAILPSGQRGSWTSDHLIFQAAPRINAAGRMDHASAAVYLLLAGSADEARDLAAGIEDLNTDRKRCQEEIFTEAMQGLAGDEAPTSHATVVYAPHWHKGVIGIVASKLIAHYYRPTVVLCGEGEILTGSARSVEGVDLYAALEGCRELLTRFGGHTAAAGLSLKREDLTRFRELFDIQVSRQLEGRRPVPEQAYDLELGLGDLSPKLVRILSQFAPHGPANPRPLFLFRGLEDTGRSRPVGSDGTHLKLSLRDAAGATVQGIGFGLVDKGRLLEQGPVDVLAQVEENIWQGNRSIELRVEDLTQSVHSRSMSSSPSNTA